MDETEELEKGSGGDDEGDDGQRKFDGDDEVWLYLAKQRLLPIPEFNEKLAYLFEGEESSSNASENCGIMESDGSENSWPSPSSKDLKCDILPVKEFEELKEKAKMVSEALRALDTTSSMLPIGETEETVSSGLDFVIIRDVGDEAQADDNRTTGADIKGKEEIEEGKGGNMNDSGAGSSSSVDVDVGETQQAKQAPLEDERQQPTADPAESSEGKHLGSDGDGQKAGEGVKAAAAAAVEQGTFPCGETGSREETKNHESIAAAAESDSGTTLEGQAGTGIAQQEQPECKAEASKICNVGEQELDEVSDLGAAVRRSARKSISEAAAAAAAAAARSASSEKLVHHGSRDVGEEDPQEDCLAIQKECEETRNTSSKSVRVASASEFPDLTVGSVEERMNRVYWQMPFRHDLFKTCLNEIRRELATRQNGSTSAAASSVLARDPDLYAPTGDVYSYFQRRRMMPFPFEGPSNYQVARAAKL